MSPDSPQNGVTDLVTLPGHNLLTNLSMGWLLAKDSSFRLWNNSVWIWAEYLKYEILYYYNLLNTPDVAVYIY